MEMTDDKLKKILDNLVDKLYTKGDITYKSRIIHNDSWFAHRENKRADIFIVRMDVEIEKLFPLSKNYDPSYSERLKKALQMDNIQKYLGMPNLVIVVEYEWESQENQNYQKEVMWPIWRKMRDETIDNMVNDKELQDKIIKVKGSPMTNEEFKSRLKFTIWEHIEYDEGELAIEVVTHYRVDDYGIREDVLEHVTRTINKYGLQDLEINNNIGELV